LITDVHWQILVGISDLLNEPNNSDPAQYHGYEVYKKDKKKYERCSATHLHPVPVLDAYVHVCALSAKVPQLNCNISKIGQGSVAHIKALAAGHNSKYR
jgi:hypothetical protein